MTKTFCDRCKKELDEKNMKFVGLAINDYSDYDSPAEHWDFCHECALSVKQSMIKNIVDYEKENS